MISAENCPTFTKFRHFKVDFNEVAKDSRFDLEHFEHAFHMDSTFTVSATMDIATTKTKSQMNNILSRVINRKIAIYILDECFILRAPKARNRRRAAAEAPMIPAVMRPATQNKKQWSTFGLFLSRFDRLHPNLAAVGPILAKLGHFWPNLEPNTPKLGNTWTQLGQSWTNSANI